MLPRNQVWATTRVDELTTQYAAAIPDTAVLPVSTSENGGISIGRDRVTSIALEDVGARFGSAWTAATPESHNQSMEPTPTGMLRSTDSGVALELTRTIAAPREDVWASLTESPRTALWFGPWERISDNTVRVTMRFEEGEPASNMAVEACEPPSRLAVRTIDEMQWQLEVRLDEKDGSTVLILVHSCESTEGLGDIGPGWEYYLDMLVASRDGTPLPSFDDYYPSQQEYYSALRPQ